jgi:hypothetical protein
MAVANWIDRGLSFLLILGGIGHTLGVMSFYQDPHTLFWALTDSVLLFLLAAINLLRTWQPDNKPLALVTACASAANLVITLRFGELIGNMADFRVILFAVLSLGLTGFSLRGAMRRSTT